MQLSYTVYARCVLWGNGMLRNAAGMRNTNNTGVISYQRCGACVRGMHGTQRRHQTLPEVLPSACVVDVSLQASTNGMTGRVGRVNSSAAGACVDCV